MKNGSKVKGGGWWVKSLRFFPSPLIMTCFVLLVMMSSGCVKRAIVIESTPPGAEVWINEHRVGVTPIEQEFITHGRYKFRLKKSGFKEVVAREKVRAPIYQWIPFDFFAEFLLPIQLDDRHLFQYTLDPESPEEHLRILTPEVLGQAVQDLKDPDPTKRRRACVVLAASGDSAYAAQALEALKDPEPTVRATALTAFRSIRGPLALEKLLEALRYDGDPEVRWQAALELEILGDPEAVPDLIEALEDRSSLVRTGAAEALKGIPDSRAVTSLIRALRDADTSVRRAAVEGLGKIGDRAAVRPLIKILFHRDFQTRRRAVQALKAIRDPVAGPALVRALTDWDPQIRRVATEALMKFGDDQTVPRLIRSLRAWKPWTRSRAAQVLGAMREPSALEPLRKALRRESDGDARLVMVEAIQQISGE